MWEFVNMSWAHVEQLTVEGIRFQCTNATHMFICIAFQLIRIDNQLGLQEFPCCEYIFFKLIITVEQQEL